MPSVKLCCCWKNGARGGLLKGIDIPSRGLIERIGGDDALRSIPRGAGAQLKDVSGSAGHISGDGSIASVGV